MPDLLSLSAHHDIRARYGQQFDQHELDRIFWLYHVGAGLPEGQLDPDLPVRANRRWRDAEQFLEVLDNACSDPAQAAVLDEVFATIRMSAFRCDLPFPALFSDSAPNPVPRDLLAFAKRVVAASCSTFLEGVTRKSARTKERWLPYQQWLGSLRETDTILSFNYDRVIELLSPTVGAVRANGEESRWGVQVMGVDEATLEDEFEARAARLPALYKLHGSVDWSLEDRGGQERVVRNEWAPALLNGRSKLAIATPGDSKMQMAGGHFKRLWDGAADALRVADEIHIIGFRFPPSDAFPRDRILAPVLENEQDALNIHVVLGPDRGPDLRRVLALLQRTAVIRSTLDGHIGSSQLRMLIEQPLWAEDHLSVWAGAEAGILNLPVPRVDPI